MRVKKIIVKEVFKSNDREEIDKAIRNNIVKLITRQQKIEARKLYKY